MQHINVDSLISSVDAATVARYIGMEISQRGRYMFIHCPGHEQRLGKIDSVSNNCVLTEKGYHCFGCQKTVKMTDMVMEYLGCSYKDALAVIAEAAGGISLFAEHCDKKDYQVKLPLSPEEMEVLGFKNTNPLFYINKADGLNFEDADHIYELDGQEVLVSDRGVVPVNLTTLYKENRDLYNKIILEKAKEVIVKYDNALESFASRKGSNVKTVYRLFEEDGCIPSEVFTGIKNACKKRKSVALNLIKEYSENAD